MTTISKDLLALRRDPPTSAQLREMASNVVAVAVAYQHEEC
jgi:hypothetical protein